MSKTSKRQKPRRRDAARSIKHPAVEAAEKRQKLGKKRKKKK